MIPVETDTYRLNKKGEAQWLTFKTYEAYDEVVQVFTTRKGGVSTGCCEKWNFGAEGLDTSENILKNFAILGDIMGAPTERMVRGQQTHSANILVVKEDDA